MTTTEFRTACVAAIGDGSSDVIIELDRPSLGRDTMRLVRSKGPKGNVLGPGRTNKHTLVLFQVDTVLLWLGGNNPKESGNLDDGKTNAP